jgi:glycosyltransferase involved in cell wall biosynthesis
VSVCVPTYNRVRFLRESLATIVKLDYEPLEILISDNSSDDGTEDLCRELLATDPRVRYIRHPRNLGLYGNHNFCIEASRGDLICFFHDDDLYDPHIVSTYVRFLGQHERVGVVCSDWDLLDEAGRRIGVRDHPVPAVSSGVEFIERTLRAGRSAVGCPGAMLRREAVDGIRFDEDRPIGFVDFAVWFRIAERWDVGHVDGRRWGYRIHDRSLSRRTVVSMADDYHCNMVHYCDEHEARWPDHGGLVRRWKRLVEAYLFWALAYELGMSFRPEARPSGREDRYRTVFEIASYRLSAEERSEARQRLHRLRRGFGQSSALLLIEGMTRLGWTGPLVWAARRPEVARHILGLR